MRFTSINLFLHSKGKRRSVPESKVYTPNLIAQTFVPKAKQASSLVQVAKPFDKKPSDEQCTLEPPENKAKVYDDHASKEGIQRTKPLQEGTNSLAYYNFVKRRLPIFDSALCLDKEKSCKDDESQRPTSDYGAGSSSEFFSSNLLENHFLVIYLGSLFI